MSFRNYNPDDQDEPFNYVPEAGCRNYDGSANTPTYTEDDAIRNRVELARKTKGDLGI